MIGWGAHLGWRLLADVCGSSVSQVTADVNSVGNVCCLPTHFFTIFSQIFEAYYCLGSFTEMYVIIAQNV